MRRISLDCNCGAAKLFYFDHIKSDIRIGLKSITLDGVGYGREKFPLPRDIALFSMTKKMTKDSTLRCCLGQRMRYSVPTCVKASILDLNDTDEGTTVPDGSHDETTIALRNQNNNILLFGFRGK